MAPPSHAPSIDQLLAHRAWVGRLAAALAPDEARAADLEQEVWRRALERPPGPLAAPRAWLRTVLRRARRDQWRGNVRRHARERAGARHEALPSTADLVARAEVQRRVVEAVLALREPYRSTLMLRFWEDVPPRTIAQRQQIPVETVHTRTKRALAQVRASLGEEAQTWRTVRALALPLMPGASWGTSAGLSPSAGLSTSTTGATMATLGGVTMGMKATAVGVVAGALMGAVATEFLVGDPAPGTSGNAQTQAELDDLRARNLMLESMLASGPGPTLLGPPPARKATVDDPSEPVRAQQLRDELGKTQALLAAANARLAAKEAAQPKRPPLDIQALEALPTPKLLLALRKLVSSRYGPLDGDQVLAASEVLLARDLDDDVRAEGLIHRGIGFRILDNGHEERATFEQILELTGKDAKWGRQARFQLAFTDSREGNAAQAAEAFESLAAEPEATQPQRLWYRLYAGHEFKRDGDERRAAFNYQQIIDAAGEDPPKHVQPVLDQARRELAQLNGAR